MRLTPELSWNANRIANKAPPRMELDRITSNPEILGGQPCIRGMRLPVRRVLAAGAAVSVDFARLRVRRLPLGGSPLTP